MIAADLDDPATPTPDPVPASNEARPPRTLADVEDSDPETLAFMSRAQVDALSDEARRRRVEIIFAATHVTWVIKDLMRYFNVGRDAVATWRRRELAGEEFTGRRMITPKELPARRKRPTGVASPQWRMVDVLTRARDADAADGVDFIAYPGGRRSPGPLPKNMRTAPTQRRG